MNLGKLFNLKYLKQNMKKSKGFLTVLVFIIPTLVALTLMAVNTEEWVSPIDVGMIAMANFLGMYVIPVVLAYLLYGYVYKKNSVDFVNSMPLTRSTIFTTNFIGGIVFIACIQILTAITTAVFAAILSNIYIAPAMIIDIFIVMFLAYSFVFAATTIAMTVSGNLLTQIVVTLLIVFLIPFVCTFGTLEIDRYVNLELGNKVIKVSEDYSSNYTLPSKLFTDLVDYNPSFYNFENTGKTAILVIAYFAIGLYLFNKRRMENVEKSFSKLWVHLIVKGITLVPMVFFVRVFKVEGVFLAIAIALIFIYYCLYDFITNKKVPFKYTIPSFIVSVVVLVGVYQVVNFAGEKMLPKTISINEVNGIAIGTGYTGVSSYKQNNEEYKLYIEDKDLIKNICNGLIDDDFRYTYNGAMPRYQYVNLKLKLNNGREIFVNGAMEYKTYAKAIDYIFNEDEFMKQYADFYKLGKDSYIIANNQFLSKEDTQSLIDIYNNLDVKALLQAEKDYAIGENYYPQPRFDVYYYRNHELVNVGLNPFLSEELFDKMNEIKQNQVKNALKEYDEAEPEEKYLYINISERRVNLFDDNDMSYVSFARNENFLKYLREHINEKLDMNDTFYIVDINITGSNQLVCYLKETEELDYIIEVDKEVSNDDGIYYNDTVELYQ